MGSQKQKRFLVLGETGSGKSTFINVLDNYFRGVKTFNRSQIELAIPNNTFYKAKSGVHHTERKGASKTESQTDGVTLYKYPWQQQSEFVFMDTPGFGDTRGIQQDEKNVAKIVQEASNADYLNGMILVVNGTLSRFTNNVIYVITTLKSFFPNQMANNIILVLTNTGSAGANFDKSGLSGLGITIPDGNTFIMNNMAFSKDPSQYSQDDLDEVELYWKKSMRTLDSLLGFADSLPPIRSTVFKEILEKRKDIQIKILDIQNKMKSKQQASMKLKALQASQPDIAKNIELYKNFKEKTTIQELQQKPTNHHNTVCLSCQKTCHESCGLNEIQKDGDQAFTNCAAFGGGKGVCSCSHDTTTHAHRKFTFAMESKTVENIVPAKKSMYDQYVNLQQKQAQEERGLSADLSNLQSSIAADQQAIAQAAQDLKKLCSGFNLAQDLEVNIGNLEMDKLSLHDPDARAESQRVIDSLKALCKGFASMMV